MSLTSENEDVSDFESSSERYSDPTPRQRSKSQNRKLNSKGSAPSRKNPFLNFLSEFRKATTKMRLSGSEMSQIGGAVWKGMSNKQKERFQIMESKRKTRGVRKGGKSRRRKSRSRRRKH